MSIKSRLREDSGHVRHVLSKSLIISFQPPTCPFQENTNADWVNCDMV